MNTTPSTDRELRVLLVDDEALARLRLRTLIDDCTAPRATVRPSSCSRHSDESGALIAKLTVPDGVQRAGSARAATTARLRTVAADT